jgi:hypothetical protein
MVDNAMRNNFGSSSAWNRLHFKPAWPHRKSMSIVPTQKRLTTKTHDRSLSPEKLRLVVGRLDAKFIDQSQPIGPFASLATLVGDPVPGPVQIEAPNVGSASDSDNSSSDSNNSSSDDADAADDGDAKAKRQLIKKPMAKRAKVPPPVYHDPAALLTTLLCLCVVLAL